MKTNLSRLKKQVTIPKEVVQSKIYLIRSQKIMLDRDLAALYGVTTKALNQAVKRNSQRFPKDFMFLLTSKETTYWRSQYVTSNQEKMGIRRNPHAFTEHGILMLSSVLNSERAIQVNIQIMRAFSGLRHMLEAHKDLKEKIEAMEQKYDGKFKIIFDALRELFAPPLPPPKPKGPIGFQP